jgi:hypothetical protein
VLAIEPDLRQAAIVKRVLKERVQADVVVVDSRDAAIAAITAAVPDVVLVSMLLSPRDEDDLIAHLRTLEGGAHLQTHTIPQLASALGRGEDEGGGLFSSFRKKKQAASAPAGCDPDMFADEIRVYLKRAAEKKREAAETGSVSPLPSLARRPAEAPAAVEEAPAPGAGSSWASPFEWRPTSDRRTPPPPPQVEETVKAESLIPDPQSLIADPQSPIPDLESLIAESPVPDPGSLIPDPRSPIPDPPPVHTPAPLSVWARREAPAAVAAPAQGELDTFFARLGVPEGVATVAYPEGVRIRRVRVRAAKESHHASLHGAMLLGKRMIAELRGNDASA